MRGVDYGIKASNAFKTSTYFGGTTRVNYAPQLFFLFVSDILKSGFQGVLVLAYRHYFSYLNKNSLDVFFFVLFLWWGVTRRKVAQNMPFSPSKCFSN